jgi:hemerythrin-like metal-binding protein
MFEWNTAMTTGVLDIDDQHRELINKFNELVEAEASGADRKKIGSILDFLQHYAEWHFGTEEKIMDQYQCHIAEKNKKAHDEYRLSFGKLYEQWQNVTGLDTAVLHDTIVELARWIVNHILTVDNQLHEYKK